MHELYEIKEQLMEELKEYRNKQKKSVDDIMVIKYLASAIDHICNIMEKAEEEEYSQRGRSSYDGGYARRRGYSREGGSNDGGSYYYRGKGENSYGNGGGSYRGGSYDGRGSREGGSNSAGYSRNNNQIAGMIEELRNMTDEVPDERTRRELHQFVEKMEQLK